MKLELIEGKTEKRHNTIRLPGRLQ